MSVWSDACLSTKVLKCNVLTINAFSLIGVFVVIKRGDFVSSFAVYSDCYSRNPASG